jgi:hypothetical protein
MGQQEEGKKRRFRKEKYLPAASFTHLPCYMKDAHALCTSNPISCLSYLSGETQHGLTNMCI